MSFLTYRLSRRLRTVEEGSTQAHYGEVEAIIKQDHKEARVQIYSELVANRLAALVGVDVVKGGEKPDQRAEQNTATATVGVRWSEGVGIRLEAAGAGNAGRA